MVMFHSKTLPEGIPIDLYRTEPQSVIGHTREKKKMVFPLTHDSAQPLTIFHRRNQVDPISYPSA